MREGDCVLPGTRRSIEYMRAWPRRDAHKWSSETQRELLHTFIRANICLQIHAFVSAKVSIIDTHFRGTCYQYLAFALHASTSSSSIDIDGTSPVTPELIPTHPPTPHSDLETLNFTARRHCCSPGS